MKTPEEESLIRRIEELERELAETRSHAEIVRRTESDVRMLLDLLPDAVYQLRLFRADASMEERERILSLVGEIRGAAEAEMETVVRRVAGELMRFADGEILFLNKTAAQVLGYPADRTEKLNIADIIPPEILEQSFLDILTILAHEVDTGFEYPILRADGSRLRVHVNACLIWKEYPFIIEGVARDITGQREMEAALRESERRYRNIFNAVPVSIREYDYTDTLKLMEGLKERGIENIVDYCDEHPEFMEAIFKTIRLVDFNDETVRMDGARSREEVFREYGKHRLPEVMGMYRHVVAAWWAGQREITGETVNETLDGRRINVLVKMMFPREGEERALVTATDITARKEAERALLESERRYRNIFNTVPVSIREYDFSGSLDYLEKLRSMGITDPDDFFEKNPEYPDEMLAAARLVDCNEETVRMYGAKSREEIFQARGKRQIPEVRQTNRAIIKSWLEGKRTLSMETVNETLTGKRIHILLHMMLPQRGGEERVLVTAADITERVSLEEERLKADKLESIGLLAGGIAHDFNNILVSILGNISLAKLRLGEGETRDILSDAENAASRARDLTYQLLTFSKGGAPVKESASISGIIRESAGFCLRGSNVRCEFSLPRDLWPVEADRCQMSQVVNNLILNAMQAMPEGGIVTVEGENLDLVHEEGIHLPSGRYVKIAVRDRGVGISPENLPRVFDPYFTTKEAGTGLGLATVWSIIRNHGGQIRAESEEGGGSVFTLLLPAAKTLPELKRTGVTPNGERIGRILVMDDEPSVCEVLANLLAYLGHEAETCRDGEEALLRYRAARGEGRPFDAVIMDLTIPGGMGGKEAVRELLKFDPEGKVIVSSGYSSERIASDYREYGFRAVLAKPYQMQELREALERALGEQN